MLTDPVRIKFISSRLQFRFPFRIAHGIRTHTDVVIVSAHCKGHTGFGEATLPPYLPDTIDTVSGLLSRVEVKEISYPYSVAHVFDMLDSGYRGCMPGKAALDMALWQLQTAIENPTAGKTTVPASSERVPHSYTISIGTRDEMREKIDFAHGQGFTFFKLKLDGVEDDQIINDYHALSSYPFAVDINQGWSDIQKAKSLATHLEGAGCLLIEQPFEKSDRILTRELRDSIGIPVIADESCQRLRHLEEIALSFSGVNIKLQKCGGMTEARRMITHSRELGLKVLMGCMSESSIGCSAAETLAPLCDWADLDGPWLIKNDAEIVELAGRLVDSD